MGKCEAHKIIQLHRKTLSAKSKPGRCRESVELAANEIRAALDGTHLLFIIVGMGGGTGTETAPVIARIAKEMGIDTVALTTMPFIWEGIRRMRYAEIGIAELQSHLDMAIVFPNDERLNVLGVDATMNATFDHINEVMKNVVAGIAAIVMPKHRCENSASVAETNPDHTLIMVERAIVSLFVKTVF